MSGKKLLVFGLPLALLAFFLSSGYLFAPDDRQQIRRAIYESTAAARRGESGPVLSYLSRSFQVSGIAASEADVAKLVKLSRPEVAFLNIEPRIDGDEAVVRSPVQVKVNYMGYSLDQTLPNVQVNLRRETGFKWLVVPEPRWRIVNIDPGNLGGI